MNYRELFEKGTDILEKVGIQEAKLDARLLLECVCGTDHSVLLAHPEREISEKEQKEYEEAINRRAKREPVAYIMGNWSFMGLEFKVSEDVLIPEQDTEILVEEALRFCEDRMRVLDLCTGSGCIGLSILKYTNETHAVCTDISDRALEIAKENAASLGIKDRADIVKADIFPEKTLGKFDIIVSNPPYIATDVIEKLSPEVKDYEPRLALDGDSDGLLFYRRIIENVDDYIYSNGYLFLEIGYDQKSAVVKLLENKGRFHDISVYKDYSGNDRVISACFY